MKSKVIYDNMRGCIAICSAGFLGLITEEYPHNITYPDENKRLAYVGIHLSKELFGQKWFSRSPKILGAFVGDIDEVIKRLVKK